MIYSVEAEQSVLGTIILDAGKREYIYKLHESFFYHEPNRKIYQAIKTLINENKEVDTVSVADEVKRQGGKISYTFISQLAEYCVPHAIDSHIKILQDKQKRRTTYEILSQALSAVAGGNENIGGINSSLAAKLDNLQTEETTTDDTKNLVMKIYHDLQNKQTKEEMEKYFTGIPELDQLTVGLHKEEVTTIAAKSGVGKTAFALQIARRLAGNGLKVLFISREMSDIQMGKRIIAALSGVNSNKLRTKELNENDWVEINKALSWMSGINLHINTDCRTITEIKGRLRSIKADVLIIDYLQLLTPEQSEGNREREVAKISRDLKNISIDFKIPVVQLSQLNDEFRDGRPSGERAMRESKAIYQDSNNVIYLHKPAGKELEKIFEDNPNITPGALKALEGMGIKLVEVILDKQRDGATGRFLQYYMSDRLTFKGIEVKR